MPAKLRILSKNIPKLKKKLFKRYYSPYIRIRASDDNGFVPCITCEAVKDYKEMHTGHFKHSAAMELYFDERNTNPQCYSCNVKYSGRLDIYAQWLEEKYGYGIIQELESMKFKAMPKAHFWLEVKIEEYSLKLKNLKEERGIV